MPFRHVIPDNAIVELCDSDRSWGPLVFLRPPKERALTLARTVWMALVPGLAFGGLGSVLIALGARALHRPMQSFFAFPTGLSLLYFVACSLVVAPAWNRRAARLSRLSRFRTD